jgi:hypothetical protein
MKISYALAIALAAAAVPAFAQSAAETAAATSGVAKGSMIFSSEGRRIGRVDRVRPASVSVIYNGKFVEIPSSSLTASENGFKTSLSKVDLAKL